MAQIKVRFLTPRPGANGIDRWFWTPSPELRVFGWRNTRLAADTGRRGDAIREAERLNSEVDAWRAEGGGAVTGISRRARAGTWNALIDLYKSDDYFLSKEKSTRIGYKKSLRVVERFCGDEPMRSTTTKDIKKFYNKLRKKTPSQANAVLRMIRTLYVFAISENLAGGNPAKDVMLVGTAASGLIWPSEAVDHFVATADRLGRHSIGTAVRLNEWMGQREGDILTMPWSRYRDGFIYIKQSKRGAKAPLPVDMVTALSTRLAAERARLDARKVVATTIIVNEDNGLPYLEDRFRHVFAAIRAVAAKTMPVVEMDHLDAPVPYTDLKFMHLRHTAATRLYDAAVEDGDIGAITGHSLVSIKSIMKHYRFVTTKQASRAFQKRLDEENKG